MKFPVTTPVVSLIGPTAIGKTSLSVKLAHLFDFEIISVDSMQVYKYMDIGTAKITVEEMNGVRHHLIDVVTPDKDFDAVHFEKAAIEAIKDIRKRGRGILLTGGTGLYLQSLLDGLSANLPSFPDIRSELQNELVRQGREVLHQQLSSIDCISAKRIHVNDTQRLLRALEIYRGTGKSWSDLLKEHQATKQVRFPNQFKIGLTCDRKHLYEQIELRTEIMMEQGFQKEVEGLLSMGYDSRYKAMRSIGYDHMVKYLDGYWDHDTMVKTLKRDTRRYAKRQFTWFSKVDNIVWYDKSETGNVCKKLRNFLDVQ